VPVIVIVNWPPPAWKVFGSTSSIRGVGFGIRITVTSLLPKFTTTAIWESSSTSTPKAALPTGTSSTRVRSVRSTIDAVLNPPSALAACVTPLLLTTAWLVSSWIPTPVGAAPTLSVWINRRSVRSIRLTVLLLALVTTATFRVSSMATPRGKSPSTGIVATFARAFRSSNDTVFCPRFVTTAIPVPECTATAAGRSPTCIVLATVRVFRSITLTVASAPFTTTAKSRCVSMARPRGN
jgi:hypothetical protein